MKKIISLIKATLTQDMNIFKYSANKNSKKITKILLPVILFTIVCVSIGSYAYMLAKPLHEINLTYIMLTMFLFVVTILTFIEGIYKSQGILFEAKDNDMLFSLPIKKENILFIRLFKLILFQYIFNLMFLLPSYIIYIYFEHPNINFYLLSILIYLLIPIIPTIISSILGYITKIISSKFKSKKIIQTIFTSIIFMGIYFFSFKLDTFIKGIATKASSINDLITSIYYPIGLYINLINKFNFIDLLKLIIINIIPFILFIIIGSKLYFKTIYKSNETSIKSKGKIKITKRNKLFSLSNKEFKRYFSSPVYMFNTSFGLLLLIVASIIICIKGDKMFFSILSTYGIKTKLSIELIFYIILLFSLYMTSITSSSISLEGKTMNITKSLPIKTTTIFNSKLLFTILLELPFITLSTILVSIKYKFNILIILLILISAILIILLNGIIGLIINLKYPKLNYSNDTEVVKQSISSMLSVFIGMTILIVSIVLFIKFIDKINLVILISIYICIIFIVDLILYKILTKYGIDEYNKLIV